MSSTATSKHLPAYEYPGLGLPLRHDLDREPHFPIGAHGSNSGSHCEPLFVREVAMMDVMERLTNKPDWDTKVFDDEIVARWRKEALAIPDDDLWKLAVSAKSYWADGDGEATFQDGARYSTRPDNILNENAFNCCIEELRSKAKYYQKTGIVPTLDAMSSVAKSDCLVTSELRSALQSAFSRLKQDNAESPDWHPDSNEMVQDLVHPSMYPLVYGRSRVFKAECVGVKDSIQRWAGKGEVIEKEEKSQYDEQRDRYRYGVGAGELPPQYWSDTYQWLPANVAFKENGGVSFTSYINNLHPERYPDIYHTIEELIQTSLPMWDQCLKLAFDYNQFENAGRHEHRIDLPESLDDEEEDNWHVRQEDCADIKVSEEALKEAGYSEQWCDPEDMSEYKWKAVRKAVIPEASFKEIDYSPKEGKRLVDRFKDKGLQVLVKLASIELTPEKPSFPAGGWHIEGQMNEHICATALYYLDSENVTSSSLSFRMQTDAYITDEDKYSVGQDAYHWMESVFGTSLGGGNDPCLQNYGTVETRQGRLLAFPNVLQHRVSPFELIDKTKPGHRRFIALWLVDPNLRIISTANVPPQQMSWYAESVLGSTDSSRQQSVENLPVELVQIMQEKGALEGVDVADATLTGNNRLPEELMEMVRAYFDMGGDQMPMTFKEANDHRKSLMEERGAFRKTAEDGWQQHSYSFCEH